MTTWILIWVVFSVDFYPGNAPIATASAVFHSQESCEKAAKIFKKAYCFEDKYAEKVEGK